MTLVEDAFGALVDQFKDPFAFVRELVQNALDAGSSTIEVWALREGDVVSVEVKDFGDGMDREIIESKLVKLFASSKDGDATKIGKFGIGFASVFSIRPERVIVETARGAERWRLVFAPDGTWKLYPTDEAIEGTRVRVLKRAKNDAEADAIVEAAGRTLRKWCRYADAEISFQGSPIAEPFDVAGPLRVRVPLQAPGDVLVVGLATGAGPHFGFYNKGLTLLEGNGEYVEVPAWASFRARDGALEHTITRDNVIHDDAHERVLAAVQKAAYGPLVDEALRALEGEHPERDEIAAAFVPAMAEGVWKKPSSRRKRKIFRNERGGGVSIDDVIEAIEEKRLARVDGPGPIADALARDGRLVVRGGPGTGEGRLLEALGGPTTYASLDHIAIVAASEKEQWSAAPLVASLRSLLADANLGVHDVVVGRVEDQTGILSGAPAVLADDPARPITRTAAGRALPPPTTTNAKKRDKKAKGPVLVLNLGAPAMGKAVELSSTDVWLATFLACRLALPQVPVHDGDLALRAWRLRCPPG